MENNIKELIQSFLDKFCTKVGDFEDATTVELYMDNHDYIEYESQGYYIPEDISMLNEQDTLLRQIILNTF